MSLKVHLTSFGLSKDASRQSEDCFSAKAWDETAIAVLADGAGGARHGREAAERIVRALMDNYAARPATWDPCKALGEFTKLINRTLHRESLARFSAPELISTLTVAVVEGSRLYGLNVGDSRLYLARDGQVTQLSEDHVDERLPHVLCRAIGLADDVEPHCFERELNDGDIAFLCSDGVSNVLPADDLQQRLAHRAAARSIVQHARSIATPELLDDMSAIVIDVQKAGRLRDMSQLTLAIPNDLSRGLCIDGYELLRAFQHSDRVWLAQKDGQRWTIKFAPLEAREDESVLNQFVKEAWNATRLQGEHFVRAFVPEGATARYYVMEFFEAPSLRMLLTSRRLGSDEAVGLGAFLLAASRELLRFNLVHGDIKPENILVAAEPGGLRFKLIDLGLAAEVFSVSSRAGTASYLAPERFAGAPICERTEIFSIGVTLFQALTGAFPYGEIERFQTPHFRRSRRPSALNPRIPPWLETVLLRALAVDPQRRYAHYSAFEFELSHPEKVEPFHDSQSSSRLSDPLQFYRVGFWLLLAATLGLLLHLFLYR